MLTCVPGLSADNGWKCFSANICEFVTYSFVFLSIGIVSFGHTIFLLLDVSFLPVYIFNSGLETDDFIFSKKKLYNQIFIILIQVKTHGMKFWGNAPEFCGFWEKDAGALVACKYLCNHMLHFHLSVKDKKGYMLHGNLNNRGNCGYQVVF